MTPKLKIRTQGSIGHWVDTKFEWVMRHISGTSHEATQKTHRWNNHHLNRNDATHLNMSWMVNHQGDKNSRKFHSIPILEGALAHATKYGGWKHYLVLTADTTHEWYIGWRWSGGVGVSRIKTKGPVRVLIGPSFTEWFGIEADSLNQISIKQIGEGYIGEKNEFTQVPLF